MEHPFRVDEFSPSDAPPPAATEDAIAPPLDELAAAPLPPLPNLPPSDVQFLRASDPQFAEFLPATSKRKQLAPALRAVCKTERAVAAMVDWVRVNKLNFAVRCGGHSYEGLSQTSGVAIDVRGLKRIVVDKASQTVTVGAGVSLFEIYSALAAEGLALQAGSCPTVGISGHLAGGGHGLLARSHGLACDTLLEATLVDAEARVLQASPVSEPNLYWACRGGGGGSFGVATEFKIKVFALNSVLVFGVGWSLPQKDAGRLFAAWQHWAPNAPADITSIMKVGPGGNGLISMRCVGQSVGGESELRNELQRLTTLVAPSSALTVGARSFLDAVKHFAGSFVYESILMKAKSDYVLTPLGADGIAAMMATLAPIAPGGIVLLCDSYGGKIADLAPDATAFPRRTGTQFCIQYFSEWSRAADTVAHLAQVAKVYAAMRPFMFNASYVNYCDLDLRDYASAYWGDNLARLVSVKQQYDPGNLFHHAQSVPLSPAVA